MTTPHKHADVLIAIAEGREVECRHNDCRGWVTREPSCNPLSYPEYEWRVKPVPVIRVEWLQRGGNCYLNGIESDNWDIKITYEDDKPIKVEAK
jgi:hypothetical protein